MGSTIPPINIEAPARKRADILLVDDDKLVLRALERMLRAAGYSVVPAADGQTGAREAMTGDFDLIVSDIHMPGITGTQMLDVLRSQGSDVPVVLMTGAPTIETAREAVDLGAVQYLTKPIEREALLRAVARAKKAPRRSREDAASVDRAAAFDRAMGSLWMAFQPIVSLSQGRSIAYEALMRGREPTFTSPLQLLEYAESHRRLPSIGRRVRELCGEAVAALPEGTSLFMNLHPKDLLEADLYATTGALAAHASRVVLEITERGALDSTAEVVERIRSLRALGYRVAIDDLGAGYAGLTSVAVLEPDFVKLDMSLTRDLASSPVRKRLVASMVGACRDCGMLLVAEGVETAQELDTLRELGCDLLQGYYFARPAPEFADIRL